MRVNDIGHFYVYLMDDLCRNVKIALNKIPNIDNFLDFT
jgi:hypothetical protein